MKRYELFRDTLQQRIADVEELQRRLRDDVAEVNLDEGLTADAKVKRVEELRKKALDQFRGLRAKGDEAAAAALESVDQHAEVRPTNTAEALLAETRIAQGWARVQRLLDAGASIGAVIADAAAAGDTTTLRAVRSEFPSYLKARHLPRGGVLEDVANDPVVLDTLATVEAELDAAEAPYLRAAGATDAADAMDARPKVKRLTEDWQTTRELLGVAVARDGELLGTDRLSHYYRTHPAPAVIDGRLTEGETDV